ncbi:M18 family aminopeptidase [Aurantivibrio infirmus]
MKIKEFNTGLLDFIQSSPSPFHAVESMIEKLENKGFQRLNPSQKWTLKKGQGYFLTRNDSSLAAFVYGRENIVESGIRLVGAHTDSPCLRVKPNPTIKQKNCLQVGVEIYGGVLLSTWFDRDLSLAGRVSFTQTDGTVTSRLIDFKKAIAVVPSLAIHLDREVNNARKINPQTELPPLLANINASEKLELNEILKTQLINQFPEIEIDTILDFELSFYDTQAPAVIGLNDDFIASARLDNLASCYIGLQALLEGGDQFSSVLICTDHEEVGSQSSSGAQGPFLKDLLTRIIPDSEERIRCIENSLLISADNAHGIHPNYMDKHDGNHGPLINKGPVIKINANQRYATNSETSALFKNLCNMADVSVQSFVMRADMACGSTIGPITSSVVGVATIDVGIPTFAMHSIRELAGYFDSYALYQVLLRFHGLDQLRI